jgi:hypothetical protein
MVMSLEMGIWLAVVVIVSIGMLLGIFALTNRVHAIDERLFDLRRLEIELSRGFNAAIANESSQLTVIKLRLYRMKRQQDEMLQGLTYLSDSVDAVRIEQTGIQSRDRD